MPSALSVPGPEDLGLAGLFSLGERSRMRRVCCGSVPGSERLAVWKGAGSVLWRALGVLKTTVGLEERPAIAGWLHHLSVAGLSVTACTSWTFKEVPEPTVPCSLAYTH